MIVFTYLGFWFLDFMMLYGHRYMSLPLFAITVIYLIEYIKKGKSRPSLVKTIFFALCSLFFLVISIIKTPGGSYNQHINPPFQSIYYVSIGVFATLLFVFLLDKTITSIIKYVRLPKTDKGKKKSLVFSIIWSVVSIIYFGILLSFIYLLIITPGV